MNSEMTTTVVIGGAAVALFVVITYLHNRKPKKTALEQFIEGNPTQKAIQYMCNRVQNGDIPKGDNRETVLHLACRHGNLEAVRALLPLFTMEQLTELNFHGCNIIHLCGTDNDHKLVLAEVLEFIMKQPGGSKLVQQLINTKTFDNQWTPLHIYAAKGFIGCMEQILALSETHDLEIPVNEKDGGGHTALVMSSANGFIDCVRALLALPETNIFLTNSRCKSCLYFATFNRLVDIVDLILDNEIQRGEEYRNENSPEQRKLVDIADFSGNSPLHAACLKGSLDLVVKLVAHGASIDVASISGDTCLHICCQRNDEQHHEILEFIVDKCDKETLCDLMKKATSFGCTPLHDAAYCGNWKALSLLHKGREEHFLACLEACDNDGLSPVLSLCRGIITYKAKKFNPEDLLKSLNELMKYGCNPNGGDFAKSTCLHFLCYGTPDEEVVVRGVNILLEYNADPTSEDTFGWSPLHAIHQSSTAPIAKQIFEILEKHANENQPEYMKTFDKNKARNIKDRTFVEKAGPHNRIPIEERNKVLQGDFTVKGIAQYIKNHLQNNPEMKIVVLVGAGISVNCGIPDFRSKDTGIYSKMNPGQFSLEFLANHPQEFYSFVREIFGCVYQGSVKPSDTHLFLKLLADKGLLQRLYTQNIDTIENLVGIDSELIVPAHGSFETARCATCMKPVEDMKGQFWAPLFDAEIPSCSYCGRVVRPDVVFFGENMPAKFFELHHADLKQADLLIVMGTSLVVYPFASLVSMVPLLTPRLLVNKNLTGPFTKKTSSTYRDAVFLGDCDDGVSELVDHLGWSTEFNALKEARDTPKDS
eukprot:CAMPEP_0117016272 /NCGR_PEP_ID=MMETSP0472-20121206/12850_1 /TAXON_ID=693140 ORGANISM="Tiarina fusus, Strain LIS" /NCGR_SAMPLE_ID=MMETSP0472 /ASSEMBLY_ACC=CAM_ASM_000603 /LENGTH=818 /DNA_ID=CAMNT_0004720271 /DNA_START=28 /DNA_END=2487 /DNA_ORIENTATION=+